MSCLYPIFVDVCNRRVVVIGGGVVAERKVQTLLACDARVVVVSPHLTAELEELGEAGLIEVYRRGYQTGDVKKAWLVIAATDGEQLNRQIYAEASQHHILCNVIDQPELCSFQAPAAVSRGNLQIAISTGGVSPALAKRIRIQLQQEFGPYYETFLGALEELRGHVKRKYPTNQERRATILEEFVNGEALDLLRQGREQEFEKLLAECKDR